VIRLLGRATSANVQKVIFLLEESAIPYEREDYGRQFANTATPEYLAMNPTGKVPTLIDGATVVWESHTILRYLAATHASPLYPTDPAARSAVERWMDWGLATLNPVFLAGFRDAKKPEAERGPDTAKNLAAELAILDARLAHTAWLAGEQMSLAEIALGPMLRRCVAFPFERPPTPHLAQWCARLAERPAFVTATAAG
jgi:glutathione S-transferase